MSCTGTMSCRRKCAVRGQLGSPATGAVSRSDAVCARPLRVPSFARLRPACTGSAQRACRPALLSSGLARPQSPILGRRLLGRVERQPPWPGCGPTSSSPTPSLWTTRGPRTSRTTGTASRRRVHSRSFPLGWRTAASRPACFMPNSSATSASGTSQTRPRGWCTSSTSATSSASAASSRAARSSDWRVSTGATRPEAGCRTVSCWSLGRRAPQVSLSWMLPCGSSLQLGIAATLGERSRLGS
mmetsp:Transcript_3413/g.9263  ORF Transcript_3413/g.9263 Transcript_3413/m.9263 type:complete len:243 (-) Transcript_3413:54-782(-)